MAGNERFENSIGSWLQEAAPDRLPQRVLEATFERTRRTRQRLDWREIPRSLRVPGPIPALGGVAVVVIAAALAFNVLRIPGFGGEPTASPSGGTQTAAPTGTPAPTPVASGIAAWTMYTSPVYGITVGYPDDWRVLSPATRPWRTGDSVLGLVSAFTDILVSADGETAFSIHRVPADPGADLGSREGLGAFVCALEASVCEPISTAAQPMCFGAVSCLPAVLVPLPEGVVAFFADPAARTVTVVAVGREDASALTAEYGGSVQLLKAILTTLDVWAPKPGQIPPGA